MSKKPLNPRFKVGGSITELGFPVKPDLRTTARETLQGNKHRLEVFNDGHSREQIQYSKTLGGSVI